MKGFDCFRLRTAPGSAAFSLRDVHHFRTLGSQNLKDVVEDAIESLQIP